MPYISAEDREELEPTSGREAMTTGEVNFQVTCLVDGFLAGNLDYDSINAMIGVLGCVSHELYRRIAAPYEDQKLAVNGDVFTTQVRPIGGGKVRVG